MILLINPPSAIKDIPDIPPLGLAYLASVLRNSNFEVVVLDLDLERERLAELPRLLADWRPNIVGLGGLTLQIENAFKIAREVKERLPRTMVVVGGPHASALPEDTIHESLGGVDVVVAGEGEYAMLALAQGRAWDEIPGIYYRQDNVIQRTASPSPIANLDELPLPARDLLPMHRYRGWGPLRKRPTTHLIASRGCPFDCAYCSEKAVFSRGHRRRNPLRVVDEIEHLVDRFGMREVSFYDDLFTLHKNFVLAVCQEMIRRRLRIEWKALSRVDTIDREMLQAMREAGCWLISYGFESGSQQILDNIRKKQTVAQCREAARLTRAAGIRFFGFFMIGNIGETESTIFDTLRLARDIHPDYWQFTITRPDPGSFLYHAYRDEIHVGMSSWDDYYAFARENSRMPVVGTDLSVDQLLRYKELAYMSLAPTHFIRRLVTHLVAGRWGRAGELLSWTARLNKR